MSTKITLKSGADATGGYRLFEEAFDDLSVHLELTGVQFLAGFGPNGRPSVTVQIPLEWAEALNLVPANRPPRWPDTNDSADEQQRSSTRRSQMLRRFLTAICIRP